MASPSAAQRGWRSRNFSFCCTHTVASRRAFFPFVRRCNGPTLGIAMRSMAKKDSCGIRFRFKYWTHCLPASAVVTMKASAMTPRLICSGKSKRFCVGSSTSLMRPSTWSGKASRSSSANRCLLSTCSSRSFLDLARSSWYRRVRCSSCRESRKDSSFLSSSPRVLARCRSSNAAEPSPDKSRCVACRCFASVSTSVTRRPSCCSRSAMSRL
mmetsp:Transcript_49449/g.117655  ORF Transcript_49449/g.117655 Transcript_49449/m.117655 type:complete len:212 (+) Transcript_49449:1976-2611(+)